MSFGYSVGDAVLLGQLAWNVVQNSRKACGEHAELTREVSALHVVLQRLEQEVENPESLINKPRETCREGLLEIVAGCGITLGLLDKILAKYNSLSAEERSGRRLWQKVKFGNGEIADVRDLSNKAGFYVSAITFYLNMASIGSIGKIEKQMDETGGDLKVVKSAVNTITTHLISRNKNEDSILTAYPNDDRAVWKELRRDLLKSGFSSSMLHRRKALIMKYIEELGNRGLLDDQDPQETFCESSAAIEALEVPVNESSAPSNDIVSSPHMDSVELRSQSATNTAREFAIKECSISQHTSDADPSSSEVRYTVNAASQSHSVQCIKATDSEHLGSNSRSLDERAMALANAEIAADDGFSSPHRALRDHSLVPPCHASFSVDHKGEDTICDQRSFQPRFSQIYVDYHQRILPQCKDFLSHLAENRTRPQPERAVYRILYLLSNNIHASILQKLEKVDAESNRSVVIAKRQLIEEAQLMLTKMKETAIATEKEVYSLPLRDLWRSYHFNLAESCIDWGKEKQENLFRHKLFSEPLTPRQQQLDSFLRRYFTLLGFYRSLQAVDVGEHAEFVLAKQELLEDAQSMMDCLKMMNAKAHNWELTDRRQDGPRSKCAGRVVVSTKSFPPITMIEIDDVERCDKCASTTSF